MQILIHISYAVPKSLLSIYIQPIAKINLIQGIKFPKHAYHSPYHQTESENPEPAGREKRGGHADKNK
ncbi:MAG: hypothetical protein K2O37_00810, partial [Bacteroidales bacterium]|nr:hypothetical protein [Bacteroidales bacterium]